MTDPINNPFIKWDGDKCPVPADSEVEYTTKHFGDKVLRAPARILEWKRFNFEGAEYITAYRPLYG